MTQIRSHDDYMAFVRMLARNNLERDGSSPRHVAETAVVDTENVGDETAILHSLEPYADDPAEQTRVWPSEVIPNRREHTRVGVYAPDDLRDLAVEILTIDIHRQMMEIETRTVEPQDSSAPEPKEEL